MLKTSFLATLLLFTQTSYADSISLGLPRYAGNGCPSGSVDTILSPDASQLSVLFDSFTVEASASLRADRKSCDLTIPVHVPSGVSIALVKMDYRGFTSVPEGASTDLDVDSFFIGVRNNGPRHHCGIKKRPKGDFYFSNQMTSNNVVWSPCGKDIGLKILSSLSAVTNKAGEQTLAALDSLDVAAGLTYQIQWQACTEPVPQPHHPPPAPPAPMPMPLPLPHPQPMPLPLPYPRPQPMPQPMPLPLKPPPR